MPVTIRCPQCRGLSQIPDDGVGAVVDCPFCTAEFRAIPDVAVVRKGAAAVIPSATVLPPRLEPDFPADDAPPHNHGLLVGLALLPLALPMVWVILATAGPWVPIFSPVVPSALGVGATVLCLGVVFTRDWSMAARLRAVAALILLAFGTGAFLFFLKKEWGEAVVRRFGPDEYSGVEYKPGPFRVKFPGKPRPDNDPLITVWPLTSVFHATPNAALAIRYTAAHGRPPADLSDLPDDDWFAKVKELLSTPDAGDLKAERGVDQQGYPGKEYVFERPDGATNRTVRVYRVRSMAVLLSAEGALLPPDAKRVTEFFKSFFVNPR